MSGPSFQIELSPEPVPERTDLSRLPFAVLLANARMLGLTGILELRGEKRVFIARGNPVHVDSDLAEETSELYLLRTGAIDESDIAPARELARSQGGKIGEALLGLGLLEANELFEHTRNRARDSLIACFQWEHGAAHWEPRERFGPDILPIPIDVNRVFFDGILRFYDRRRLDRELPIDDNSRLYLVPSPRIEVSASSIGTVEARLLKLAQGRPSLPSAALAVGLAPDDLRRRLYALYCLGVVGFEVDTPLVEHTPPPPKPPIATSSSRHVPRAGTGAGGTGSWPAVGTSPGTPVAGRSPGTASGGTGPWPAVGTSPGTPVAGRSPGTASGGTGPWPAVGTSPGTAATGRSSALPPEPARQSALPPSPRPVGSPGHPSTTPRPPVHAAPTVGRGSSPGFAAPTRDSQLPPPPSSRPSTAPPAPRAAPALRAPKAVQKIGRPTKTVAAYIEDAELSRTSRDWDGALLAIEYALELEPENPFLWSEKAFTLMLRDPRAHGKEANVLARDARREDPSLPIPYVVLGMLMEQVRETERAIQMYRVALQKDPICEAAQSRLEAIEDKKR